MGFLQEEETTNSPGHICLQSYKIQAAPIDKRISPLWLCGYWIHH